MAAESIDSSLGSMNTFRSGALSGSSETSASDEGIDVAAGGDQIQVGLRAGLGRFDVGEILRAVHHPELFIAAGEIQDFSVLGNTMSVV